METLFDSGILHSLVHSTWNLIIPTRIEFTEVTWMFGLPLIDICVLSRFVSHDIWSCIRSAGPFGDMSTVFLCLSLLVVSCLSKEVENPLFGFMTAALALILKYSDLLSCFSSFYFILAGSSTITVCVCDSFTFLQWTHHMHSLTCCWPTGSPNLGSYERECGLMGKAGSLSLLWRLVFQ